MSNTDKINAYLEGELSGAEKQQFEQALSNNAELRRELKLQTDIVEGIKEARRLEIKAMLDQVPVGGSTLGGSLTFGKIISGLAIVGIVSLGIYYFTNDPEVKQPVAENEIITEQPVEPSNEDNQPVITEQELTAKEKSTDEQPSSTSEKGVIENKKSTKSNEVEINRPSQAPMFETGDSDSLEAPTNEIVDKIENNTSSLDVEIDNTRKKFSFHYQFNKGKLFLYGDFDEGLYEILEFKTTSNKMLFLCYKDKFYPLDKQQVDIVELKPVTEQSLIEKLKKVADFDQE